MPSKLTGRILTYEQTLLTPQITFLDLSRLFVWYL
jgi:hypothetical protein